MLLASIAGQVFYDVAADGLSNGPDYGIAGQTVYVDANANGSFDGSSMAFASSNVPKNIPDQTTVTSNLNVSTRSSYCYEDAELNCRRYGRLYTWESAQRACQSLGDGWGLPTDEEWRQLAKHYGGLVDDSPDKGKAAFTALLSGGTSGFNAVFAGTRSAAGQYERLETHGIYWTSSVTDQNSAPFYNFGKGGQGVSRHVQGGKQMALSVRCVSP